MRPLFSSARKERQTSNSMQVRVKPGSEKHQENCDCPSCGMKELENGFQPLRQWMEKASQLAISWAKREEALENNHAIEVCLVLQWPVMGSGQRLTDNIDRDVEIRVRGYDQCNPARHRQRPGEGAQRSRKSTKYIHPSH
jgi:hypothetical protein